MINRSHDHAHAGKTSGMDAYTAVSLAEGIVDGDDDEILAAWQYLVDSGLAWTLQGWFGRQAAAMINSGLLLPPGAAQEDSAA